MAAAAYLIPPVTGFLAFVWGTDRRVRVHGLQSVLFGLTWPLLLYLSKFGPGSISVGVFFGGLAVWVTLIVVTAMGKDVVLPPIDRLAEDA